MSALSGLPRSYNVFSHSGESFLLAGTRCSKSSRVTDPAMTEGLENADPNAAAADNFKNSRRDQLQDNLFFEISSMI